MAIRRFFICILLFFVIPFSVTNCTSSDDDVSVLEEELEDFDIEGEGDAFEEDIEDFAESDEGFSEDFESEDDEYAELSDDDFDDLGDELDEDFDDEFASSDDDFGDEEFSDDDLLDEGDDLDGEFASMEDDDSDPDFDDFGEFEQEDEAFAQNEESLAQEMQDYPVAENAQPQFPEEVMGEGDPNQAPMAAPVVTSETQDIALAEPTPVIETVPQDDLGMADPIVPLDDSVEPASESWVPVVKVKTDPFYRNQRLMNAVYIARPSESFEDISQKLYGSDRTQELRADNPHLAKGIDPGDKIYYNSPNRSDDRTNLKIYYSDIGVDPQFYSTEQNDNMRRLGSKLLGFADGWKEIWAINPNVDSKTILPAGLELKYWTGNESKPTLELADNAEVDTMPPADPIDDGAAMGEVQEPFEDASLPPEPPLPEAQIAEMGFEPEPVPDIEPFPEAGIEPTPGASSGTMTSPGEGQKSLLSVGAIALLIMAGTGLVAIQIKKRKDATGINPHSLEYTQV